MIILNHDDYGYAINGEETFLAIGAQLPYASSVAVLWTDGEGSAVSLLFSVPHDYLPGEHISWCGLHPAVSPTASLVVAAREHGMMAIPLFDEQVTDLHPDYVREKLGIGGQQIADLINGVLVAVRKEYHR